LTFREVSERVLAAKGATAGPKAVRDMINALHGSFTNNRGKIVERVEEGPPQRWALLP
jgi:hypothetical protein